MLPKTPRALGQPCKTRHDHLQAPRHPVLLPARRQSPCTHTNCSLEYTPTPPRFIRRRADTRTAVGSRRHTQARAAPFDEPRGPPVNDAEREKCAPLIRVPRHHRLNESREGRGGLCSSRRHHQAFSYAWLVPVPVPYSHHRLFDLCHSAPPHAYISITLLLNQIAAWPTPTQRQGKLNSSAVRG